MSTQQPQHAAAAAAAMVDNNNNNNNNEVMVDITHLVEQCAAASLHHSNPILCNEASFSLHDSMAALELMDRKMDCCELPVSVVNPQKYKKKDDEIVNIVDIDNEFIVPPRPIPTGLNTTAATGLPPLPWTELTVRDAADIGLEILTRLESLLSGASVAESTYTCLYAHNAVLRDMKARVVGGGGGSSSSSGSSSSRTTTTTTKEETNSNVTERLGGIDLASRNNNDDLPQFLVYAQTLALVEISDVVRSIVLHADIYEEEDFSVNTFGLQFFPDADGPETMKTLEQALDRLDEYQSGAAGAGAAADEADDDTVSILTLIITFQLKLLQTCTSLAKLSAAPARQVTMAAQAIVRSGVADLERLQALLLNIEQVSSSSNDDDNNNKNPLLTKCFDPYVYRPLVGSSPVRKVAFHAPHESVPILIQIFLEIDWAVCDLLLFGTTMVRIRRLLHRISVSSVNILSRSLIVLNLYFDDKLLGQHTLGILIGNEMIRMMGLPHVLLESKYGKAFLNRLAKPMYDTLKLLVLNRNRQRTYMEAIMFHDWSALQQEAHVVDMNHRQEELLRDAAAAAVPPYFTQYALYTMVWLMDHHVALGIELRLYCGQHDLAVAYWYRDFLLSSLLNTLSSIRGAKKLSQQLDQRHQQQQNGSNKSADEDLQDDMEVMIIGFKRSLCRGIVRVGFGSVCVWCVSFHAVVSVCP